ncbi:MAG: response regulator [Phycisphaerales bacterium]|nr:MAG: response regulator [Phycisphaerales bacterium]
MSKVLVVDDEPGYCRHLELLLSRDGHEVESATNGRDAMDIAQRFRPDVLVADWMLCDTQCGLDLARSLRQLNPRLATIIITGYYAPDLQASTEEALVHAFIQKPFEPADLCEAVRQAARPA